MKRMLMVIIVFTILLMGCGKADIVKTYEKTENNEIMRTYYKMNDETWKCDDIIYKYRLELCGRTPTADADGCYCIKTKFVTIQRPFAKSPLCGFPFAHVWLLAI